MTSIIQKKPPAPRPDSKQPLVRPPVTPPKPITQLPVMPPKPVMPPRPPIVRPGPIRASDTGRVPPSDQNTAIRGGTPISMKDAPGYRGIGTPTMPSSLPLGAKKGGVVTTRKISTATKSKKQSSW